MMLIKGKVLQGKKRGRELGYPTLNVKLMKKIPSGIYISNVHYKKKNYPAATFVGNATTFGEKEVYVESYILNFDKNMYNKWIKVRLIKKIRDNRKFSDVESLKAQIKKDVDDVDRYFKE